MPTQISLWSGDYTLVTGQALVTVRVVRHQLAVSWREHVYRGAGLRSAASWAGAAAGLWRDIALGRVSTLYLVCSRSNGGFLRDVPALLSARAGVRVVVHVHGSDIVDLLSNRRLAPLARALYAHCEIVVPSAHLVEPLRAVMRAPVHVCENYFASDTLNAASPPVEELTVLWNSNVMANKGFFDVAEAILQVTEDGLPVQLVSIGQPLGDEEMTAQEATQRLHALQEHKWLDYRGKVDQATAIALMAEAHAVCLTSRRECQPLAIIQAMCAGKATVVSDIPALRATLGDYPAHFVPVRSVAAIAEALRDLHHLKLADPTAFVSSRQEAAAAARERFSAERFDREMAAILGLEEHP
jgi:glycosyltransferase involved in cell wall biosynthesis